MKTLLSRGLIGLAAMAVASGSAFAQSAQEMRRQTERDYNQSIRKGQIEQRVEVPPPVVVQQQTAVVPLQLVDQFPHQGTDNPSGLMGQLDFNDEGHQVETYLGPGLPVTGTDSSGQLDPQEAPPTYRRGP